MDLLEIDIALARRSFDLRVALSLGAETVAIIGPSGAGKTSLLRAVAGLEHDCAGLIVLDGERWLDSEHEIQLSPERRRVGYLPQDFGLFPHLTVSKNVRFAGKRERPDLLERLGISHLAAARPRQLSGGERQRVALARALAREPRVLLLDEPFGALDAITRRQVRDELGDILAHLRLPSLLVTHAFDEASALAHRIAVIDQGRLVQLASAEDLLAAPATAGVATLTGANILQGSATATEFGSTIRLQGGGELDSATPARGPVQIAVHPWQLEIADADACALTDTILSVHAERGSVTVRLTRFTLQTPASENGHRQLIEGALVGLRAARQNVKVLPAK